MSLIILILNIVGTFLLSVEAIKLENFERLRNRLRRSNSIINPKIDWAELDEEKKSTNGCFTFLLIVLLCFSPISFIVSYYLGKEYLNTYGIAGLTIFGSFVIWTFIIYTFELIIKFLKIIETSVARGSIGIIGFMLLLISFILQYFSSK